MVVVVVVVVVVVPVLLHDVLLLHMLHVLQC